MRGDSGNRQFFEKYVFPSISTKVMARERRIYVEEKQYVSGSLEGWEDFVGLYNNNYTLIITVS